MSVVFMVRVAFVATLVRVTLMPGIGFPCGSLTVPPMPDVPVWPHTATAQSSMQSTAAELTNVNLNERFIDLLLSHTMIENGTDRRNMPRANARRHKLTSLETPGKTRKDLGQPSPPLKPI